MRYFNEGIFAIWHSAWMYGEIQGLAGISLSDSFPLPPHGYNFMDPLGLDEPSASIGPLVGCLYNSAEYGSQSINYPPIFRAVK